MGLSQTWPAAVVEGEADPLYLAWQAARRARAVEWSAANSEAWRQTFTSECVAMSDALRRHIADPRHDTYGETHTTEHEELSAALHQIVRDAGACQSRNVGAVVELVERATLLEMKFAQHQNRLRSQGGGASSGQAAVEARQKAFALAAVMPPGLPFVQ